MKRTILLLTLAAAALLPGGCCSGKKCAAAPGKPEKVLIAYYSWSGSHNTRTAARMIQKHVGGDLYEIEMVKPYSTDFKTVLTEARRDLNAKTLPALKPLPELANYTIVFVGSPIWYGSVTPPVKAFLAKAKLAGKTVVPFCTHGTGRPDRYFAEVTQLCPAAKVLRGFAHPGAKIAAAESEVAKWVEGLEF